MGTAAGGGSRAARPAGSRGGRETRCRCSLCGSSLPVCSNSPEAPGSPHVNRLEPLHFEAALALAARGQTWTPGHPLQLPQLPPHPGLACDVQVLPCRCSCALWTSLCSFLFIPSVCFCRNKSRREGCPPLERRPWASACWQAASWFYNQQLRPVQGGDGGGFSGGIGCSLALRPHKLTPRHWQHEALFPL